MLTPEEQQYVISRARQDAIKSASFADVNFGNIAKQMATDFKGTGATYWNAFKSNRPGIDKLQENMPKLHSIINSLGGAAGTMKAVGEAAAPHALSYALKKMQETQPSAVGKMLSHPHAPYALAAGAALTGAAGLYGGWHLYNYLLGMRRRNYNSQYGGYGYGSPGWY